MARNLVKDAEAFVRETLKKNFGQRIDPETARAVAEKIARQLPAHKRAA